VEVTEVSFAVAHFSSHRVVSSRFSAESRSRFGPSAYRNFEPGGVVILKISTVSELREDSALAVSFGSSGSVCPPYLLSRLPRVGHSQRLINRYRRRKSVCFGPRSLLSPGDLYDLIAAEV
jgi:hypothetical protein